MGDSPLAGGIRGTASTSLAAHFRLLRLAPGACWPDGLSTVRWTDVIPFLKQAGQAQGKHAEAASSSESLASPRHASLQAASAFRSCRPIAPAPTPATTGSPHIDRVSLPRRHPKLCKPQCMLRGTLGFCSPQLSSQDVLHNLQVGDLLSRPLYLSGSCGPLRFDDGCDLSQRGHLIMQTLCCLPLSNGFRSVGTGSCGISCETFIAGFPCELPIPELCTDTALSCLSCCHCSLKLRCQLCFAVLPHPGREIVKRLCLGATAHHAELRRSDTCAPHSRSRLQTLVFATQVSDLQHELRSRPSERRFECSSRGARIDAAAVHRRRRCVDHRWTRVCSGTAAVAPEHLEDAAYLVLDHSNEFEPADDV